MNELMNAMETRDIAPIPQVREPGFAGRVRRWLVSAALALILAALEVGGERPLRVPTPIILLREEEFSRRFPRIRPYRAHYRRHAAERRVGIG